MTTFQRIRGGALGLGPGDRRPWRSRPICAASAGVVLMTRVRITPRVERGLRALPGSIIMATILPLVLDGGLPAIVSVGAAIVAMVLTRSNSLALAAGLGTLSILRALGL